MYTGVTHLVETSLIKYNRVPHWGAIKKTVNLAEVDYNAKLVLASNFK